MKKIFRRILALVLVCVLWAGGAAGELTKAEKRRYRLVATYEREDYATDEIFANFRAVRGGSIGENVLFRSAIPSSLKDPRAPYADTLAAAAGVRTVLNLANSPEQMEKNASVEPSRFPYYQALYREGNVIARALPAVWSDERFRAGVAEELRFLIDHEGPYLIHCAVGKDRTGFLCFVLGALLGAAPAELERDYGESYVNYYHLKRGEVRYKVWVTDALNDFYRAMGGSGPLSKASNPAETAKSWLLGISLSESEIAAISAQLQKDH